MSEAHKGKPNLGRRGKTSWIKGKHHTEETKQKMRERALGKSITQHRVKDRPKGRPLTDEDILKINDFLAGL